MSTVTEHNKCRLCGGHELRSVLNLGHHYLHGLFVLPDFNPPTRKIPTHLVRCENPDCGLVQLKHSVDPDILYAKYGYRSSTNATMRDHLTDIARKAESLWSQHHITSDTQPITPRCLDIGCNDGFLSRQFNPKCYKVGIDPCDVGNQISGIERFKFINSTFPSGQLGEQFDIITMIACFYDVNEPLTVAKALAETLSHGGILVLEVSYWPAKMEKNALDEVCHEHVCFYNYQNLESIFSQVGLKVFDVRQNDINGGSIQLWLTHADSLRLYNRAQFRQNIVQLKISEFDMALDTFEPYSCFIQRCANLKNDVCSFFEQNSHASIHLYGASTKGNVLLQFLELDSTRIPYAAERSKEKWGGRTLGTNIKMISEEESRAMKPDYYFVPIWSFKDEILKREQEYLASGGQLVFPIPQLSIVKG